MINLRFGGVNVELHAAGRHAAQPDRPEQRVPDQPGSAAHRGHEHHRQYGEQRCRGEFHRGSAPFQDYATFLVTGRLNLFQANEIDGNTTSGLVPTQLLNSPSVRGASPGRHLRDLAGWCGHRSDRRRPDRRQRHQLHDLRDRGSAERGARPKGSSTPRSATSTSAARPTTCSWSPRPARAIFRSGLGMDNVTINSLTISSLRANRDATNSNVTVEPVDRQPADRWRRENTNVNVGMPRACSTFANYPSHDSSRCRHRRLLRRSTATIINPQINP